MNIVSTAEAAERLGVSTRRILVLIKEGKIIAKKVGRDYAIEEKSLSDVRTYGKPGRPAQKIPKKGGKKSGK